MNRVYLFIIHTQQYQMLVQIFVAIGLVFVILFFVLKKKEDVSSVLQKKIVEQKPPKKQLGEIQVFYASQTGTAAKMASNFAEEAAQYGFTGVVISLKDITHEQFKKNQLSVFFMANTGEGQPPQNSVKFMKMLTGKEDLQGQTPQWQNINYSVFGLGDTQYQHFNKVGIDCDTYLQRLGGNRLTKIGLGDANSSTEDDYIEWKTILWPLLVEFRQNNPYQGQMPIQKSISHIQNVQDIVYLSQKTPLYANYRFCIQKQKKQKKVIEKELDFKTKASLLGKYTKIQNIIERRQNNDEGSSLQLQVHLQGQPGYQTSSNIALWPVNDPQIINDVLKYFNLNPDLQLDTQIIDLKKNNKYNFVAPITVKQLLQQSIDLQFRITKGILKKLSKFQSKSSQYFLTNSSPKTTQQYKRLSDHSFTYLFKLVKQFEVKLTFEDFIQLSQAIGPRLFTIASSWKAQKNVVVIASIQQNGLISKNFQRNPQLLKAQLRKSSFGGIQKYKKVIFVGAGTGFAAFRGYLQQKQLALKQNLPFPIITLYFGCRKSNSDFIYKQQILNWQKQQVINKLHLAFSRQTEKRVYVQDLLIKQLQQINQFIADPECALYICGSTGMGKQVVDVIQKNSGKSNQQFRHLLADWEKTGKLVKQLW